MIFSRDSEINVITDEAGDVEFSEHLTSGGIQIFLRGSFTP